MSQTSPTSVAKAAAAPNAATKAAPKPAGVSAPKLLPLVPRAHRATWRCEGLGGPDRASTDSIFAAARKAANERDGGRCRYCGFAPGADWLEVDHLDEDHANNALANLASTCRACHLTRHLGWAGQSGEAILIWMPDLAQHEINHLARAVHAAMRAGGIDLKRHVRPPADAPAITIAAVRFWIELSNRSFDAINRLGTSKPAELGEMMLAMDPPERAEIGSVLGGIRLLPRPTWPGGPDGEDLYPRMLDAWLAPGGPFASPKTADWDRLAAARWNDFEKRMAAGGKAAGTTGAGKTSTGTTPTQPKPARAQAATRAA